MKYSDTCPISNIVKVYLLNDTSNNMTVDGSTVAVDFKYTVPTGYVFAVSRLMLFMESSGAAQASDNFGNLTALTNGLDIIVGGTTLVNFKDNVDLATTMFDLPGMPNLGKETLTIAGRWTLTRETSGEPIFLQPGEEFIARVRDNLTTLSVLRMKLGGRLI